MVFTLGLRHTFLGWSRGLALVQSLVVQTSLASFIKGGVVKAFRCGTLAVVARTSSAAMKQAYFRVISASGLSSADDLRGVVTDLLATILGTSEYAPMKPHDKGGYCLFLEYPDDSVQSVIDHLTANDWRPCF